MPIRMLDALTLGAHQHNRVIQGVRVHKIVRSLLRDPIHAGRWEALRSLSNKWRKESYGADSSYTPECRRQIDYRRLSGLHPGCLLEHGRCFRGRITVGLLHVAGTIGLLSILSMETLMVEDCRDIEDTDLLTPDRQQYA